MQQYVEISTLENNRALDEETILECEGMARHKVRIPTCFFRVVPEWSACKFSKELRSAQGGAPNLGLGVPEKPILFLEGGCLANICRIIFPPCSMLL